MKRLKWSNQITYIILPNTKAISLSVSEKYAFYSRIVHYYHLVVVPSCQNKTLVGAESFDGI